MSVQGKVEIRRSARRKRTVSARREGDVTVILMPAGLSAAREAELVEDMLGKLERSERRRRGRAGVGDEALMTRAKEMSERWLGGAAQPASVRWVPVMRSRWASCTQTDGTIRVSEAARGFPAYVLDYLLVHELAHLVAPGGHTPRFWELVRRYPRTERAIGYLEASSAALRDPASARAWGADADDGAAACDGAG
ncbi:M48 family metallopeptidase [Tomitella gaofuii]|uniref:M48 metallopeptidase family protein n=1 Tax=Tomitella gaofuii TaxID=2760083 RepID=UPI002E28D2D4|nr:M48 family metallopeptidase [Tomitella gaofuii]